MTDDNPLADDPRAAPLTPADCDLRGLEWMPLYGDRLFSSETWLEAGPEGRCAALALWWAAWKQCPAGSLADSDRILAQLAGYGLALKQWRAIRDEALRGWVKCSDGRLYHPVVCEFAIEAMEKRHIAMEDKNDEKERQRRHRKDRKRMFEALRDAGISVAWNITTTDLKRLFNENNNAPVTENSVTGHAPVTSTATAKTGQDRTGKESINSVPTEPPPRSDGSEKPPAVIDVRTELFREGVETMRALTGRSDGSVRAFVGRALKGLDDDAAVLLEIIREAQDLRPADPLAWIVGSVKDRSRPSTKREDKFMEGIMRAAGLDSVGAGPLTIDHEPQSQARIA